MKKFGRKLAEFAQKKLAWGCAVLVATQIQGYLPSLDFLPARELKLISFLLAVLLTVMKGVEMFYERSEQLAKTGEISFDTEQIQKPTP